MIYKSLLITLCSLLSLSSAYSAGIEFFDGTWKEALEKAKAEDKLLFVDAYATWCGPCKRMAKQVFTQDIVGDYFNDNFVNLKLDMEKTDGLSFGKEYPVSAYPTLFFIGADGTVVRKVKGGQKAETLIEHGKKAYLNYDRSGDYVAKYEAGNRDYDLVYPYVKALAQAKKPYLKIANDYLRSHPNISVAQRNDFLFVAAADVDSKIFEEMLSQKKEVLTRVSTEEWDKKITTASLAAVDKAIEYDYPELMEEAITIAREHLHEGGKTFEHEARMRYAVIMHDAPLYTKEAKKYIKRKKNNGKALKRVITEVHNELGGDKDAVALAANSVEKALKYGEPELGDLMLYTKVLAMAGKQKKALKLIAEAKEKHAEDKRMCAQLEQVEEKLKAIEPVQ